MWLLSKLSQPDTMLLVMTIGSTDSSGVSRGVLWVLQHPPVQLNSSSQNRKLSMLVATLAVLELHQGSRNGQSGAVYYVTYGFSMEESRDGPEEGFYEECASGRDFILG